MRKYGLIGYPLGHSFSKGFFTEKFIREKIDGCTYDNYPISDIGMLPALIENEPDLQGLNVTIPYKSLVFPYIDILDPGAAEVGAVNVLKIDRSQGKIKIAGFNSDITGIMDSLKPYLSGNVKSAIVLGTGGSSRAVCYILRKYGIDIVRVSRKRRSGMIEYSDLDDVILKNAGLIVNTTPLGMFPDTDTRPDIMYNLLDGKQVLFDLVYNPELTYFLRSGMERGCTVITGLKMLHSQAEKSWEIWNDEKL